MPNRLASETSPYLLQHEDNPVDWYPWGEEALSRAREEDRPLLLSIGYSACHWCHVMERESFEDPDVAERMNREFVNVKVDREERPDLDSIYMTAVQSMTGSGGWPLTVFLTPDGVPFYGGTYFPPEPRHGMPSFPQVLEAVADAWRNRRDEVRTTSRKLVDALRRATTEGGGPGAGPEPEEARAVLDQAVGAGRSRFDEAHGGFGGAPKFPQAPFLDFLLRRAGSEPVVSRTLDAMARGGIRDHLGGGFHRYTVDARWLVPHFEKMLYDNALLARLYLHHHLATGGRASRRVAEETLDWLLEDMRSPDGGFYSARDADSEGEEGRFYVWDPEEVDEVLGDEAELFRRVYDVTPGGNWEGVSILHLPRDPAEVAEEEGMAPGKLEERLARSRRLLKERRAQREPPLRDEKILAGWNGLVLRALAEAGPALDRPDYTGAARDLAGFLLDEMREGDRLLHVWTDGSARIPAFLEDWAATGTGLLALHGATLEERWLEEARRCARKVIELFWDEEGGAFFDTPEDGEELVIRPRDAMDNPSPSGTSLAVELLQRTALIFDDDEHRRVVARALRRDLDTVRRHPSGFGTLLSALDFHGGPVAEVAVVGAPDGEDTARILQVVHGRYLPRRVVVGGPGSSDEIPLLRSRDRLDDRATAYVCRDYACEAPVTDPGELASLLEREAPQEA